MAASSKPTGEHYALVVFVLISIICGLGWLLAYRGAGNVGELRAAADAAKKKADNQQQIADGYRNDVRLLKTLMGYPSAEVGEPSEPGTVTWSARNDIRKYSTGASEQTIHDVLTRQGQLLREAKEERNRLQAALETEQANFRRQVETLTGQIASEAGEKDVASRSKIAADNSYAETVKLKEKEIADLRKTTAAIRQKADEESRAAEKKVKELDTRIANLKAINQKVAAELDLRTRSFTDKPQGQILELDRTGHNVFVSLGKADALKPQATFSVYQKPHGGLGKGSAKGQIGSEDIKGAIEISRVLGPHLSQARITRENLYRPLAKGDPIYSPLWSSGLGEAYSLVGIIDLDRDGKDDRDLLFQSIAANGAVVDNDVDAKGILRIYGKIEKEPRLSAKTKFVVIGRIPEVATAPAADRPALVQMHALLDNLRNAAREHGVRVVSLGDFLNYIGYTAQKRLVAPGENAKDVPKAAVPRATESSDAPARSKSPAAPAKVFRPK